MRNTQVRPSTHITFEPDRVSRERYPGVTYHLTQSLGHIYFNIYVLLTMYYIDVCAFATNGSMPNKDRLNMAVQTLLTAKNMTLQDLRTVRDKLLVSPVKVFAQCAITAFVL